MFDIAWLWLLLLMLLFVYSAQVGLDGSLGDTISQPNLNDQRD